MFSTPAPRASRKYSRSWSVVEPTHVRCEATRTPNRFRTCVVISSVLSRVEPPAPNVQVITSGCKAMRWPTFSYSDASPAAVFGGNSSKEREKEREG
jgi:hypothetical protein